MRRSIPGLLLVAAFSALAAEPEFFGRGQFIDTEEGYDTDFEVRFTVDGRHRAQGTIPLIVCAGDSATAEAGQLPAAERELLGDEYRRLRTPYNARNCRAQTLNGIYQGAVIDGANPELWNDPAYRPRGKDYVAQNCVLERQLKNQIPAVFARRDELADDIRTVAAKLGRAPPQ